MPSKPFYVRLPPAAVAQLAQVERSHPDWPSARAQLANAPGISGGRAPSFVSWFLQWALEDYLTRVGRAVPEPAPALPEDEPTDDPDSDARVIAWAQHRYGGKPEDYFAVTLLRRARELGLTWPQMQAEARPGEDFRRYGRPSDIPSRK